ncbi:MAG: methyltransferase domain-containing protein [Pseudomonadota bacterium]
MATTMDWQGEVGAHWAAQQATFDHLLASVGEAGMAVLAPKEGERILDLGCGAGASTRALAASGARATGVDISPDLVALARAAGGGPHYLQGDAGTVDLDGPHDALFSRCGSMFFATPVLALAHLRQALRPGARAVLVCWRDAAANPWIRVPLNAVSDLLGAAAAPAAPGAPGLFAWADPEVFLPILRDAGWEEISHTAHDVDVTLSHPGQADPVEAAIEALTRVGPLRGRLADVDQATVAAVEEALRPVLAAHVDGDAVRLGAGLWIVTARAP